MSPSGRGSTISLKSAAFSDIISKNAGDCKMYIEKIEIQYFRSIYRETISGLKLLNIFTGKNDVGKSNILKALNLFFNNETDYKKEFKFEENYNFKRLEEVRRDSIKGKQYIQIKVTFFRGNRSEKTLPEKFTVAKKWLRNDVYPSVVTDDLEKRLNQEGKIYNARSRSSLTAYLNKIRYIYVPAIKDNETFRGVFDQLQEAIYSNNFADDTAVTGAMEVLARRIAEASVGLSEEFESVTGVKTSLSAPKSIVELYQVIGVDTEINNSTVNLDKRGDGIRVRYLPSILHYIAKNSTYFYIWGFEEPENSLEYNLALKMAENFENVYCKSSMILVTSHSPAFIGLTNSPVCEVFRAYRENETTHIVPITKAEEELALSDELGYLKIQADLFAEYKLRMEEFEKIKEQKRLLLSQIETMTKPVLYTEGITDVLILQTAWAKLYGEKERPFDIKSCNVLREEDGSAAGCDVLKDLLATTRPDCPQIVIGLFDRDKEGLKSYALNSNFVEIEDGWKEHKNKHAHAIVLPIPPGKESFAELDNLCIEFYFEKEYIDVRIDDKGLELEAIPITQQFNGKTIDKLVSTELHFHQIKKNSKRFFAETVVPTLPEKAFEAFGMVFDLIERILTASGPQESTLELCGVAE